MNDLKEVKETSVYNWQDGTITTKYEQDVQPLMDQNKMLRNATPEFGKYKGNLVHAMSLSEVDVLRLKHLGYDLMSPDKEERRRAIMYIQQNEPYHMVTTGKPFSKKITKWY